MSDSIENQCFVAADGPGSKIIADFVMKHDTSQINVQISGNISEPVIRALNLISTMQGNLKRDFNEFFKVQGGV